MIIATAGFDIFYARHTVNVVLLNKGGYGICLQGATSVCQALTLFERRTN